MPSDLASLIAPIGCGSGLMCGFTQGALTTDNTDDPDQVIGRAFWESVDRGTTLPLVCLIRVLRVISGCSCSGACFAADRGDRRCGHDVSLGARMAVTYLAGWGTRPRYAVPWAQGHAGRIPRRRRSAAELADARERRLARELAFRVVWPPPRDPVRPAGR